jgi:TolB-like protein/Tfp pilus assembly protein PilF
MLAPHLPIKHTHPTGMPSAGEMHPRMKPSLFAELRRRNVFRAAAFYIAAVWALAQGIAQLGPAVNAPDWTTRWFLVAAAIGFPFWLAFSWFYDWTPQGIKRDGEAALDAPTARRQNRKLDLAIIAALAIAVVLLLTNTFVWHKGAGLHDDLDDAPVSLKSIAVLPFVDMSSAKDQEYFSDGISEELLNLLAKIPQLQVTARTSSFALKGQPLGIREVARKLHVAHVLEGSVRKAGDAVRITAQLIDAASDKHLWSQTYDRKLDDIFAIQDDIAADVVKHLQVTLLGPAPKTRATDPEAYRLYLRGRDFLVGTDQEMDKSIDYFQQAIARAPDYAMAHAGLADAYATQAFLRANSRAEVAGKARAEVNRALELDPDLGEAHASLGQILFLFDWDWAGADAEFKRAVALAPGSEAVRENYGEYLNAMGRLDEGLAQSREAARLDPLSVMPFHDIAINALTRNHYDEAAAGFRKTIDINPDWTWGYTKLGRTLALAGKCKEAFVQTAISERRIHDSEAPLSRAWLGQTYATCGDVTRARQKLAELRETAEKRYLDPAVLATIHASLGEMDEALRYFQKALDDRSPDMVYARVAPKLIPQLGKSAEYRRMVETMGFPGVAD